MRALLALLLFAGPLLGQTPSGWGVIENSWGEIQTPTSGVSGLTAGRVTLSTGATSVGDDAGCTWSGTGASFVATFGGGVTTRVLDAGAGNYLTFTAYTGGTRTFYFDSGHIYPAANNLQRSGLSTNRWLGGYFADEGVSTPTVAHVSRAAPTCDSTTRGQTNYTAGGAGVKDTFEVCAKDVADVYAWRTIY